MPLILIGLLVIVFQAEAQDRTCPHLPKPKAAAGVYDENRWFQQIDKWAEEGHKGNFLEVAPYLEHMSEDLKLRLQLRAGQIYSSARKMYPWRKRMGEEILDPKRALDAFLSYSMSPCSEIEAAVASGVSPAQAYDRYLNKMAEVLRPSRRGGYRAYQVIQALKAVQQVLRSKYSHTSITFYGSFPVGRAKTWESDFDAWIEDDLVEPLLPEMTKAFNGVMGRYFPDSNMKIVRSPRFFNPVHGAIISPVMLRVRPDRIELLIYGVDNQASRYLHVGTRNPAPAKTYRLE